MNPLEIQMLCDAMGGTLRSGDGEGVIEGGVSTDTRAMPVGALFVALEGERFDAHDFLAQAVEAGAGALVVNRLPEGFDPGAAAVIEVRDTLRALQRLARWYRNQLDVVVIGITGSNGKTTTKDLCASVMGQRYRVHATKGNLNNHIGLPLTILAADEDVEVMVVEMGMSTPGEIAVLCEIARPHLGIITNIGVAHLEFMGSREAIAEEKGSLARALPEVGSLMLTADCDFADYFRARTHARTVVVGNARGEVRAERLTINEESSHFELVLPDDTRAPVHLPLTGKHMANNALLAAGTGMVLGMDAEEISKGLEEATITSGRLRRFEARGVVVYDDTYNANPDSVRAAIDTLAAQPEDAGRKRTIVLGMMAELGRQATELHRKVGEHAGGLSLQVVSVGPEAAEIAAGAEAAGAGVARHFDDYDEAAAWLAGTLHEGDRVLFKGSRTAAVERVMNKVFPEN